MENKMKVIQRKRSVPPDSKELFLAGGCFWGTQEYIVNIFGVLETDVGYANGYVPNPTYEAVCNHETGFVEAVRVAYDPAKLSLSFLLKLYFESIDPVAVNRQGGDCGEQYRTGIYYTDETDLPVIQAAVSLLEKQIGVPTAVEVKPLENYYLAEEFHQGFLKKNPGGYCHIPKALFEKVKDARE
jgi:methionine-S-sulfoxide reductase